MKKTKKDITGFFRKLGSNSFYAALILLLAFGGMSQLAVGQSPEVTPETQQTKTVLTTVDGERLLAGDQSIIDSPVIEQMPSPVVVHDPTSLWGIELNLVNLLSLAGMTIVLSLISYSVLTSGKKGWGWFTVLVAVGVVGIASKMCIAVFREMAGGHCPTDWDEG